MRESLALLWEINRKRFDFSLNGLTMIIKIESPNSLPEQPAYRIVENYDGTQFIQPAGDGYPIWSKPNGEGRDIPEEWVDDIILMIDRIERCG